MQRNTLLDGALEVVLLFNSKEKGQHVENQVANVLFYITGKQNRNNDENIWTKITRGMRNDESSIISHTRAYTLIIGCMRACVQLHRGNLALRMASHVTQFFGGVCLDTIN